MTCPWHGYQYLPEDGASPPSFTEKVSTFQTRIVEGRLWIDPRPNPPGTRVAPFANPYLRGGGMTEFYVGYIPKAPSGIARKMKAVIVVLFAAAATCAIGFAALQRTY